MILLINFISSYKNIENTGQIKEGFDADIVGVIENPLTNIRTLEKVAFVMKEGKVYKR